MISDNSYNIYKEFLNIINKETDNPIKNGQRLRQFTEDI